MQIIKKDNIRRGQFMTSTPCPPGYVVKRRAEPALDDFDPEAWEARQRQLDEERKQLAARMTALKAQIDAITAKFKS